MPSGRLRPPPQLPRGWWKDSRHLLTLAEHLRNYVLVLGVLWEARGKGGQSDLFCGTLIQYRGLPHWVTAGHNLEQIEVLRADASKRLISARWYDNPSPGVSGIPVSLADLAYKRFPDTEHIDLAVAWPRQNQWDLMRASPNYRPFTPIAWRLDPGLKSEGIYIVGFPTALRSSQIRSGPGKKREYSFEAKPICIPLVAAARPTRGTKDDPFWRHKHSYYARIPAHRTGAKVSLQSLRGVSGGPVVLVCRTEVGQTRYKLLGIQCGWLPEKRIVRIEPIQIVIKMLDRLIGEYVKHKPSGA